MSILLKMIRLRAGFYVTRDGQWRIVRRKSTESSWLFWHVERWSPGELRWERVQTMLSLKDCREWLEREIALNTWDA